MLSKPSWTQFISWFWKTSLKQMARDSVTNTGCFSVATVTKVRSVFRFLGKMSVNKVKNCGHAFSVLDVCALVWYGRKNRRATVLKVTENISAGCDQTIYENSTCKTTCFFSIHLEPVCVYTEYTLHLSLFVFYMHFSLHFAFTDSWRITMKSFHTGVLD